MYIDQVREDAMTLGYQVTEPLTIPDDAFNTDGVATLVVTGGSYGGMWVLNAISTHTPPDQATAIGSIQTDDAPRRPDLAVKAAETWMRTECERLELKLVHAPNQNHTYPADQAPFFAGIMFLIYRPEVGQ